jgi:hypothetical protein
MLEESDGPKNRILRLLAKTPHTTEGHHRADTILQKTNKRTKKVTGGTR